MYRMFLNIATYKIIVVSGLLSALLIVSPVSAATIFGAHTETVVDMRVKILGGEFSVVRTWENGAWVFNKNITSPLSLVEDIFSYSSVLGPIVSSASIYYQDISYGALAVVRDEPKYPAIYPRRGDPIYPTNEKIYPYPPQKNINLHLVWTSNEFRLVDKSGKWLEFYRDRGYGFMGAVKQGNRNNVKVSIQYLSLPPDKYNNLISGIYDHLGKQIIWYEYNDPTNISKITAVRDYTGRRVEYTYTAGSLTEVKDVRGEIWGYTYFTTGVTADGAKKLSTKTNPNGRVTTLKYTPSGSVSSILDQDLVGSTFKYEFLKSKKEFYRQEKMTGGKVTETWLDIEGDFIRQDINGITVRTISKDGRNRIITDHSGNKTQKEYDERENLTKVIHPDASFTTKKYEPEFSNVLEEVNERGVMTKYEYDATGNLTKKTAAFGLPEERVMTYTYDTYGNQLSRTHVGDAVTTEAVYQWIYDVFGNKKRYTDGEGHVWLYTYDSLGNVLTEQEPASTKIWTYTYDEAGNQTSMKDPLGNLTQYEYDGSGNRIKVIDAKLRSTVYTYNLQNRLTKITDPQGEDVVLEYDIDGQLIKSTDQANKVVSITYYSDGRPSTITDGSSNAIQLKYNSEGTNGAGQVGIIKYPTFDRVLGYDDRGRVIRQTDILSATEQLVTTRTYDSAGNIIQVTDPKLRATQYVFNGFNRVSKMTDPLAQDTLVGFDNRGNLRTVTDPNSNTTTYVYDGNNRLLSETRPMAQVYAYTYNTSGRLASLIDSKDQKTEYLYDNAGRYVTVNSYSTSASATAVKTVTLNYDAVNLLSDYNDGTTSASYIYDAQNRKTMETVNYSAFTKSYSYSYTTNGRKQSYTAPDGVAHSFTYTANNQLAGIQIPGAGAITVGSYEWLNPKSVSFPGGTTLNQSYDALLRMTSIDVKDPATNPVMTYGYTLDEVGNITSQQTEHGAYVFNYDDLDRLTKADNPNLSDEIYAYDPVGNRLTDSNTAGTWGYNNNNQLTGIGATTTYVYDDNGSLTQKIDSGTVTDFVYNLDNRLSEVKQGATTLATYYYDPYGRRLSKNVGGVATYFMYADEGLIAEFNATGAPIRQYGYQPDSTWGRDPTYLKTGGQYYYYQNDHLGTPKKLTAANGSTVWSAEYLAFGGLQVAGTATVTNPLRFAGQYEDIETGFYYNFNRYYDPQVGRYVSYDPIGLNGGINAYGYVSMAPTKLTDPEGLFVGPAGAFVGGIGGGLCSLFNPNTSFNEGVTTGAIGGFFGGGVGVVASAFVEAAFNFVNGTDCTGGGIPASIAKGVLTGEAKNAVEQIAENNNKRFPGALGAAAGCGVGLLF